MVDILCFAETLIETAQNFRYILKTLKIGINILSEIGLFVYVLQTVASI